ncbi:hypothetical protein RJ035_002483 [Blastomyces gilchristii]
MASNNALSKIGIKAKYRPDYGALKDWAGSNAASCLPEFPSPRELRAKGTRAREDSIIMSQNNRQIKASNLRRPASASPFSPLRGQANYRRAWDIEKPADLNDQERF